MFVLDASALIAYLREEPGKEIVKQALIEGSTCSAANWSESMQKALARGDDWDAMRQLVESYEMVIAPVTRADAEWAAVYWQTHQNLSLADRLCLALADRLGATVLTSDAMWGTEAPVQQIR